MTEAFLTGQNFDKGAEIFDALNGTLVNSAYFGVFHNADNRNLGADRRRRISTVDGNRTVIFGIDCYVVLFGQRLDNLSARSDERPDLINRNLERFNPRRILGPLLGWFGGDLFLPVPALFS